jgi:hypothetical protein
MRRSGDISFYRRISSDQRISWNIMDRSLWVIRLSGHGLKGGRDIEQSACADAHPA